MKNEQMSTIGGLLKAIGFSPEKVIDSAGQVLDDLITNKEELARAKLELEALWEEYRDVASARSREVSLRDSIGVWVQNLAAVAVIVSFVALLFCVLYLDVPIENKDMVNILLGSLGTIVVQIFQYWFGSSAGSARKQELLEQSSRE